MKKIKIFTAIPTDLLTVLVGDFFMKYNWTSAGGMIERIFTDIAEAEFVLNLAKERGLVYNQDYFVEDLEYIKGNSCDEDGRPIHYGCDICKWKHKCLKEYSVDVVDVVEIVDEIEEPKHQDGWSVSFWRPVEKNDVFPGKFSKQYRSTLEKVPLDKENIFIRYKTDILIHPSRLTHEILRQIDKLDGEKIMLDYYGEERFNFSTSSVRVAISYKKYPQLSGNKIKTGGVKMENARLVTRKSMTAAMVEVLVGKGTGTVETYGSHDGYVVLMTTEAIEGTKAVVKVDNVWVEKGNEAEVTTLKKYGKIGNGLSLVVDGNIASYNGRYTGDAECLKDTFGIKEEVTARIIRDLKEIDEKRTAIIVEIEDKIEDINEKFAGFEPDSGLEVYKKVSIVGRKTTTGCEDPVPPIERGVVFVVDEDGAKVFIGEWQNGDKADEADLKDFNNKKLIKMRDGIDGALEEVAESVASFKRQLNK